jgi:crotonobetainyl-CoA:carnitine CoA-transferase CaiB-like acyl-CoA transferase
MGWRVHHRTRADTADIPGGIVDDDFTDVISQLWNATSLEPERTADVRVHNLSITGPRTVLPSAFDVTGLATGAVAVATMAAAELVGARRRSTPPHVTIDSTAACAAFLAEKLFVPLGWSLPPVEDPITGNYRASDGWIRLHTNYTYHRAAVEQVVGASDRESVQTNVSRWAATELENAIEAAGGCAAAMRDRQAWLTSPPGAATADGPTVSITSRPAARDARWVTNAPKRPFDGVRVLDLTRVIAGPVCTQVLAGYGADVLRVDPPGFREVPALVPILTHGKRSTALDLTKAPDRAAFEQLVTGADVLVCGLRSDALDRLDYRDQTLNTLNPDLIIASLDAYGWSGPWRARRGFDSLVQMSCGIAAAGAVSAGREEPAPLPAQALDHGTGWLLAATIARALTRRLTNVSNADIQASLIGTANQLYALAEPTRAPSAPDPADFRGVDADTAWGPCRRVPLPGAIDGVSAQWESQAGPLGRHPAQWAR